MKPKSILSIIACVSLCLFQVACPSTGDQVPTANAAAATGTSTSAAAKAPVFTTANVVKDLVTAEQIANFAYGVYKQSKQVKSGAVSKDEVPTLVMNDLSGVGSILQAYVGTGLTPTQADAAQGATPGMQSNALQVVSALPNKPITQNLVNTVFQAAGNSTQP